MYRHDSSSLIFFFINTMYYKYTVNSYITLAVKFYLFYHTKKYWLHFGKQPKPFPFPIVNSIVIKIICFFFLHCRAEDVPMYCRIKDYLSFNLVINILDMFTNIFALGLTNLKDCHDQLPIHIEYKLNRYLILKYNFNLIIVIVIL